MTIQRNYADPGLRAALGSSPPLEKMKMAITERLKPYVAEIQAAAANGNKSARDIITAHRLLCSCPSDPGAQGVCEAAFNEWQSARAKASHGAGT